MVMKWKYDKRHFPEKLGRSTSVTILFHFPFADTSAKN